MILIDLTVAMGILDFFYDIWNWVESHYNSKCTYDIIEEIPNEFRKWRRNCQCRRNLSAKIEGHSYDTYIRQEIKNGDGERWYELTWTKYQTGPTGRDWYV